MIKKMLLFPSFSARIKFSDIAFNVVLRDNVLTISIDDHRYVDITLKNQQVAYKANILGGFSLSEKTVGDINYQNYFRIDWDDELLTPDIIFSIEPLEIKREYKKGQKLELDIEAVGSYHVVYKDGVTADFIHTGEHAYDFSFSTGFHGNFWQDSDGTHSIRFKGIRLDADEDGYSSESKFIFSRSKYTDHLILIMQDDATVYLKP